MELSLSWDDKFKRLAREGLLRPTLKAARYASRDAARALKSGAARYVRGRKALKLKFINKSLRAVFAKSLLSLEDAGASVFVSATPVPLYGYPNRQGKKGVSVTVNRGKRKLIPSAFVATMANVSKTGELTQHTGVFRRLGSARLPIKELYGSSVAETLSDDAVPAEVLAKAAETFRATFARVLAL